MQTTQYTKSPDMSPLKPMVNNSTLNNRDLLNRSYSNINKQIGVSKDRSYSPMNRSYMNTSQINFGDFFEKRRHNLEINLAEDDTFSFPLLMRRSQIYKGKEVYTVESFRSLKDLHQRVNEWFRKNPELDCEDLFIRREEDLVDQIGGVAPKAGHLLIFMHKRTYARIDVKVYDGIVRLTTLDDYKALREVLDVMFDSSKGVFGGAGKMTQSFGTTGMMTQSKPFTSYNIDQLISSSNITSSNTNYLSNGNWNNNLDTNKVRTDSQNYDTVKTSEVVTSSVNTTPMVQSTTQFVSRPAPLAMPEAVDINQQKLKFKELCDYWRVDEEAYSSVELGLTGNTFLPGFAQENNETRKVQNLETLMSGDFKKVQEDMMANEVQLLKRNKELLEMNKSMVARCEKADEIIMKANNSASDNFKMDLDIAKMDLTRSKVDNESLRSENSRMRVEMETMRLNQVTSISSTNDEFSRSEISRLKGEMDKMRLNQLTSSTSNDQYLRSEISRLKEEMDKMRLNQATSTIEVITSRKKTETNCVDMFSTFMITNMNRKKAKLEEDSSSLRAATDEFKQMVLDSIRVEYSALAEGDPKRATKHGFVKRAEEIIFQADKLSEDMKSKKVGGNTNNSDVVYDVYEKVWNTQYHTLQILYKELKEDYEQNCALLGENLPNTRSAMKESDFLDRSYLNKISGNCDPNLKFDSFIPITPIEKKFSHDIDFTIKNEKKFSQDLVDYGIKTPIEKKFSMDMVDYGIKEPVIIEKEVIKTVYVEVPVEKIVYVDKHIEKPVETIKTVEKIVPVTVEKIVEKIVYVDKIVEVQVGAKKMSEEFSSLQKFCEKEPVKYQFKAWADKKPYDLKYTGLMQDGKKEGFGTLSYQSGNKFYEGAFQNDVPVGNKLDFYLDNTDRQYLSQMVGENPSKTYSLSNITGPCKLFHTNGKVAYEGKLVNGLKDGDGTEYYKNGKVRYTGNFKEGGYHGIDQPIYNGHLDKNLLLRADFDKGTVNGKVDRIWFRDNLTYNGNRFIIDAHYKDGKLDTEATGTEIIHLNPTGGYYYKGHYKNGMKHGLGAIYCDDTHKTVFKGEWKDNLPFKNADSDSTLVTLYHGKGRRMFEGNIKVSKHGGLSGYCTLYHYHDGNKVFYEGKFRAPTLCAVLFCTWDLELVNYQPFIPAF